MTNLIWHADDLLITIAVTDELGPVPLTGCGLTFLATSRGGHAPITKTIGAGIDIIDETGGLARCTLDNLDAPATADVEIYEYSIELDDGEHEYQIESGILTYLP